MKDFDFDELDRAVSSVLGGQASPVDTVAPRVSQEVVPTTERTAIEVPERTEVVDRDAQRETVERPAVSRPVGPRSMDIVRRGAPTPTASHTPPTPPVETPAEDVPVRPRTVVTMNDITAMPRAEVQPTPAPSLAEETEALPAEEVWTPPVESPFLPDAKVEKRPLGTSEPTGVGSPLEAVDIPFDEEVVPSHDEPMIDVGLAPISDPEAENVPEFDAAPAPMEEATQEITPESAPQAPVSDVSEYTAPVAITPQYTPKPSTTEEESGEIFDTESYHQPFAAQKKKKTGPLKVVLISLLILLGGAAAGAGVYFYVLPML